MNNEKFDIEKGFSEMFNSFEYEPGNSVWNNIEADLNSSFVEDVFKDSFSNYQYTPRASSWDKIVAGLWLYNFLRFSFKTFNIYYASAIIAFLFGIVISTSKEQQNVLNNTGKQIVTQNNSNSDKIIETSSANNNSKATNNNSSFSNNNDNKHINNSILVTNNPDIDDSTKTNNNNSNIYKAKSNAGNNSNDLAIVNNDEVQNQTKIITKYIKDTVFIRDTFKLIIRDTVYKEKPEIEKPKVLSPWSADVYFSPMYSNPAVSGSNIFADNISPDFNWSVGANVNYSVKNINIQTGLAYTVLGEKFSYSEESLIINSKEESRYIRVGEHMEINKYTVWQVTDYQSIATIDTVDSRFEVVEYEQNNSIVIDTIWHYTVDTIYRQVPVDSIETVKYDTLMVAEYDSVDVIIIDTTREISFYDVINRYSYLEIPLAISYEFKTKGNLSYVFGAGLITGVFINAKGKGVTVKDEITSLEELPFMKLNFTGMISGGLHYKLTKETSLLFEAFYRRNFNSIYKNDYFLKQRYNSFGVRFGLRFKF